MMRFEDMIGVTLAAVTVGDEQVDFTADDGKAYRLCHYQDCCEDVHVEEVIGDIADLVGTPILLAEEVEHGNETPEGLALPPSDESYTWTFYKLATVKGHVTIRFFGSSNGYYSESVDFSEMAPAA